jgi:hypothetical protein
MRDRCQRVSEIGILGDDVIKRLEEVEEPEFEVLIRLL